MTPRPDIIAFEDTQSVEEVIEKIKKTGLSRIPIYEHDLDNTIGFIHAKDLIDINHQTQLKHLLRRVFFVPESKRVDQLLREFKSKKMHLAMIVNEHGTVVGLITIEDLLEEIVGEIYDETDTQEEVESDIKKLNDEEFLIKGGAELDEVESALGVPLHDEDNTTMSGFIFSKFGL
jgi:CBS domain containing-hemolysin-like protein